MKLPNQSKSPFIRPPSVATTALVVMGHSCRRTERTASDVEHLNDCWVVYHYLAFTWDDGTPSAMCRIVPDPEGSPLPNVEEARNGLAFGWFVRAPIELGDAALAV